MNATECSVSTSNSQKSTESNRTSSLERPEDKVNKRIEELVACIPISCSQAGYNLALMTSSKASSVASLRGPTILTNVSY